MTSTARLGGEYIVKDVTGTVPRWRVLWQPDGDIDLIRCNSSGVAQETVLNIDGATGIITANDLAIAAVLATLNVSGLLTVGATDDTTTTAQSRWRKTEAGTIQLELYSAGVRRGQIELSTSEAIAIRTYDTSGVLVATTTKTSTGNWTFPGTVTSTGTLAATAAATVGTTLVVSGLATFNGGVQPVAVEVAPAADAAAAILNTTSRVNVSTASGANTAISTTSSYNGQRISLFMNAAAGGGSYTLVVATGTLTLNAANEAALVERIGSAWVVLSLNGATVV